MTDAPPWAAAAEVLADDVTTDAPAWHDAVCNTPRHRLVPRWWQRIPSSPAQEWERVDLPEDSPERLRATYADDTLATRVGPTHADHAAPGEHGKADPTSSSTLPGLIVSMAHRLDVRPGRRVLDVGTGSGCSAALLARRFGDENVTSVDVDPYLAEAARTRLGQVRAHPARGSPRRDRLPSRSGVPRSWRRGGRRTTRRS
ncbi:methyltransferase domain-containing protein [Streptomyces chrestomyceticus]|uniref:methyltransferase domain-containing protein n=1 Tax=Streptomyces chrestomyceticus TaxID=68185 RepID=UPI0035A9690D